MVVLVDLKQRNHYSSKTSTFFLTNCLCTLTLMCQFINNNELCYTAKRVLFVLGYGDMAVSNSIGSNVFDILICLGLPWLLDTAIFKKGDPLLINSKGIGYSALILLSTVVFMLFAINLAKWKLNKPFGCLCMCAYVVVISISCLFELNVFGDFVPPSCERT